jgi:transglutaminase-like putative cysteine protease
LATAESGPPRSGWSRAQRVVFQVRQLYRYRYSEAVTGVRQRLVMVPPSRHGDQELLEHHLAVRGADGDPAVRWDDDRFGNRVCTVIVPRVTSAIEFEATFRVQRRRGGPGVPAGVSYAAARRALLAETALTAADDRLRGVAAGIAAQTDSARERAEQAAEWAAGAISFRIGATGVQTPAALALHLGQGVCQDYAHILLCVLRLLDIPARYVSGHLPGEGVPHAWVEALLEAPEQPGGVAAVPFDPTHRRRAGLEYITVAVGRDFADVSPTSGYFRGSATGRLSAERRVDVLQLVEADREVAA